MLHRLCEPPSIPLSFSLATILPRRGTYHFCFDGEPVSGPPSSTHRLGLGLPGYLIPFATLAFAPQRQLQASKPPSPLVFLQISTHFTTTPGIPLASLALQPRSIGRSFEVEPRTFTTNLRNRLRALYTQ